MPKRSTKKAAKKKPATKKKPAASQVGFSPLCNTLREALAEAESAGWSLLAIAHETSIPYPTLHGFTRGRLRNGTRSYGPISSETIERLLAFFGMRATKPRIPKPAADQADRRFGV